MPTEFITRFIEVKEQKHIHHKLQNIPLDTDQFI